MSGTKFGVESLAVFLRDRSGEVREYVGGLAIPDVIRQVVADEAIRILSLTLGRLDFRIRAESIKSRSERDHFSVMALAFGDYVNDTSLTSGWGSPINHLGPVPRTVATILMKLNAGLNFVRHSDGLIMMLTLD